MNRQTIARCFFAVAALVIVCISCNPEDDRLLSYQHTIQVGLYSAHTNRDTTLTDVKVWGEKRPTSGVIDEELLYDEKELGQLFLNMNMNSDSTELFIKTHKLVDKLTFKYSRSLEPVSGAGGITMELKIDTMYHTNQFISYSKIVHKPVRYNEDRENVQLFIY